jgi:dihydroorotate dehydrogenase
MKKATRIRNACIGFVYKKIAKPLFFRQDPEDVHDAMTRMGALLGSHAVTKSLTSVFFNYSNKKLEQDTLGIHFKNPIGLAGGFDKNAELTQIIPSVGFGFEEVGSITGEACDGNPKPRLWRLPKSKSIVVHYGLKNDGAASISERLGKKTYSIPIGTNIAKTNSKDTVDIEAGIADYEKAFQHFVRIGDYFTVNISCPNAFGGEPFTNPVALDRLLARLDRIETKKPVFLKISPDLASEQLDTIIEVVNNHRIHGFVCSNLTKKRDPKKIFDASVAEKGGLSGKIVEDLTNDLIGHIYKKTNGSYIIIGCGGVFTAEDAYKKIRLGASLVQMITGMIFEGPQTISEINLGLAELLERDGYRCITEAVGVDTIRK